MKRLFLCVALLPFNLWAQQKLSTLPPASAQTGVEIIPEFQGGKCPSTGGTCGVTPAQLASYTVSGLKGDVTSTAMTNSTVVGGINGTSLAGLATGLLKNTTTTGVPSIAVAGTDYQTPITAYSQLPTVATGTVLGNSSGGTAAPSALTAIPGGVALPALSNVGTSLYPIFQNQAGSTINATNGSSTITCVTGCSSFYVGALIFQATAFPNNAMVTDISGSPSIVVSKNAAADVTGGVASIGYNRFDTTSAVLTNTLASKSILGGLAAQNNSSWSDKYLPTYCTSSTALCILGSSKTASLVGLRTSDNTGGASQGSIDQTLLAINDATSTTHQLWAQYIQMEVLLNAGLGFPNFGSENDVANQNSALQVTPYAVNVAGATVNQRLGCGAGESSQTVCTAAMDIVNNGQKFETGINFGDTSLDTAILAHPPAISFNAGTNGQALTWYKATGYSTPAWQAYSTNTTINGNFISLGDSALLIGNGARNWVSIGQTAFTGGNTTDNPTFTWAGTGTISFNGGGPATFQALNASYVNVTSSGTVPTTGLYRPASNTLGITCGSAACEKIDGNKHFSYYGAAPAVSSCGTSPSIDANATDTVGTVTVGSSTASCTITFAVAYATFNHCRVTSQQNLAAFAYSYTKTAITVTATALGGDVVDYNCDGI